MWNLQGRWPRIFRKSLRKQQGHEFGLRLWVLVFPAQQLHILISQWLLGQSTEIMILAPLIESTGVAGGEGLEAVRLLNGTQ